MNAGPGKTYFTFTKGFASAFETEEPKAEKPPLPLWLYKGVWTHVQEIPLEDRKKLLEAKLHNKPDPFTP